MNKTILWSCFVVVAWTGIYYLGVAWTYWDITWFDKAATWDSGHRAGVIAMWFMMAVASFTASTVGLLFGLKVGRA